MGHLPSTVPGTSQPLLRSQPWKLRTGGCADFFTKTPLSVPRPFLSLPPSARHRGGQGCQDSGLRVLLWLGSGGRGSAPPPLGQEPAPGMLRARRSGRGAGVGWGGGGGSGPAAAAVSSLGPGGAAQSSQLRQDSGTAVPTSCRRLSTALPPPPPLPPPARSPLRPAGGVQRQDTRPVDPDPRCERGIGNSSPLPARSTESSQRLSGQTPRLEDVATGHGAPAGKGHPGGRGPAWRRRCTAGWRGRGGACAHLPAFAQQDPARCMHGNSAVSAQLSCGPALWDGDDEVRGTGCFEALQLLAPRYLCACWHKSC